MDPVNALEQIANSLAPEPSKAKNSSEYRTIRVKSEVHASLEEWRELWSESSLSEVITRIMVLARRELKNIGERELRARVDTERKNVL